MSNMSYCRYQNTLADLCDCLNDMSLPSDASAEEIKARLQLIGICCDLALAYGFEIDRNITEDICFNA